MIISGKYEIPDKCPTCCPELTQPFDQGGLCMRCPILNCKKLPFPDDDSGSTLEGDYFSIIEPEDYREDWAEQFHTFFATNCKVYPRLKLLKE